MTIPRRYRIFAHNKLILTLIISGCHFHILLTFNSGQTINVILTLIVSHTFLTAGCLWNSLPP
ncbi:hypothetical protein F5883DRAFT_577051 [Diaporthe sp. PMI_573]|nr:hypothetical protein F5883DRAFT_577051 [Diaporthaceae sp. PMI_573]